MDDTKTDAPKKQGRPKPRKWGLGPSPLILKRTPRRRPEPPATGGRATFDYSREIAAHDRVRPALMEQHPGKFIVFVGEEMLGPFETFDATVRAAYKKFGRRAIYVRQLVADDDVAYG